MRPIIFESHATSFDNEKGIASGHNNPSLSPRGILEATQLGKRYKEETLAAVLCSDLYRSHDTAKIALPGEGVPVIIDQRLREWDYGRYNGQSAIVVEKLKLLYIEEPFPEGESLLEAVVRIMDFVKERCCKESEKSFLIIGHRAVYYALENHFNKISLQELVARPWKWQPGWHYFSDKV